MKRIKKTPIDLSLCTYVAFMTLVSYAKLNENVYPLCLNMSDSGWLHVCQHTHTHTHTHIYIYIYEMILKISCRSTHLKHRFLNFFL